MHLPPSCCAISRTFETCVLSSKVYFSFKEFGLAPPERRRRWRVGSGSGRKHLPQSLSSITRCKCLSLFLSRFFSLTLRKNLISADGFSTNKMGIIILMRVRVMVLHLSLFRMLHVTLVPTHLVIQFRCLCLFTFGDKKKEWWQYRTRCAGGGIPRPFQSVPSSSSASSCIIKIIAANVDEILFLLVPFCVVSSPLPASVARFIYSCHSPPGLALLSFAHVLVWSSSPSCSVSFSQFQNSLCLSLSLSLFAGTVCWSQTAASVWPVWLVSGTTLNLMIMI